MKNKIFCALIACALSLALTLSLVGFAPIEASASEGFTEKADGVLTYVKDELTPIISGLLTAITAILAMLVPYLKTIGKLKQTQGAYSVMYDENARLARLAESKDVEEIQKAVAERVLSAVEDRFNKYDGVLSKLLKESEISTAQVASLIEGAKIAWKEAEGANLALCKAPSATVLEKQSLTVDFLKSYVAKELGIRREELDKKIDGELEGI